MGSSKRIVKNTMVLYIRMIIVMLITLYSSRLILKGLGVSDFGLYNVIGGVVGLFTFFRGAMEKATQRFLNVEMAKADGDVNKIFSASLSIHIFIALLVLVITETIGICFLNYKIQIPEGREFAANCIYQSTILSLCLTIVQVPYSATVIANERMTFYAIVSIVDAALKLLVAALLLIDFSDDKLIFYGACIALITVVNLIMYFIYCRIKYKETKFKFIFDSQIYKGIFGFVGWTLLGNIASVVTNQGNTILVNMFHGVIANAAMAIGSQVNNAVANLTSNFQTAFNPQITKSYAVGDYSYLKSLVYTTTKISFSLLFLVSLPIMFNIDFILKLWLGKVPEYSAIFCILFLVNGILNAVSAPTNFTVLASGKIKHFEIAQSATYFSDLVILYLLFMLGFPPITAMAVKVGIMAILVFVRIRYANKEVECLNLKLYLSQVIIPLLLTAILSVSFALIIKYYTPIGKSFIGLSVFIFLFSSIVMFYVGVSKAERKAIIEIISKYKLKNGRNVSKNQ